mgnify:CR=1 FL=1
MEGGEDEDDESAVDPEIVLADENEANRLVNR